LRLEKLKKSYIKTQWGAALFYEEASLRGTSGEERRDTKKMQLKAFYSLQISKATRHRLYRRERTGRVRAAYTAYYTNAGGERKKRRVVGVSTISKKQETTLELAQSLEWPKEEEDVGVFLPR